MQYYRTIDEDGFITVSTLDADGDGNSTQAEHDTIAELYRNAPDGYGVVQTEDGYGYAARSVEPDPELDDSEALNILLGGAT